jgi:hypothetical protein
MEMEMEMELEMEMEMEVEWSGYMGIPTCRRFFSGGSSCGLWCRGSHLGFFSLHFAGRIESSCVDRVARLAKAETTRGLHIMCSFAPAPAHPP